jgi:flagellum-specific peptidoglycan hydrolase FlgJ
LIATHPRYAKAFALRNDPEKMLTEIQNAGYAGDPNDWYKRKLQETPNFPYKTYKDFVMDTPGYKRFAD